MPETHLEFSVPLRTCSDSQSHVLILPSEAQQLRLVRSCASFCPCANHTLHDQPLALLVSQIKFRHGSSGFGRLLIRRLNGPEVLPALCADHETYHHETYASSDLQVRSNAITTTLFKL